VTAAAPNIQICAPPAGGPRTPGGSADRRQCAPAGIGRRSRGV